METSACPDISVLSSFLDDEFDEGKIQEIKLHVQNCPACADHINRFHAADRLISRHLAEPMNFGDRSHTGNCISPEALTAYLHGLLRDAEKKEVEEHLDACDACVTELRSLTKTVMQLDRIKTEALPDALRRKVEGLRKKDQADAEQILRLVVRLTKDGLELLRDSLFPSSVSVQEMFAPVGAYRTAERSFLPSGVLLKKALPGVQLSALLEWRGESRAGLKVKIEDERLSPVARARVMLRRNEALVYSERTSADGQVTITDLDAGIYHLGIITSDKELNVELELKDH